MIEKERLYESMKDLKNGLIKDFNFKEKKEDNCCGYDSYIVIDNNEEQISLGFYFEELSYCCDICYSKKINNKYQDLNVCTFIDDNNSYHYFVKYESYKNMYDTLTLFVKKNKKDIFDFRNFSKWDIKE